MPPLGERHSEKSRVQISHAVSLTNLEKQENRFSEGKPRGAYGFPWTSHRTMEEVDLDQRLADELRATLNRGDDQCAS